ncbi:hypothetical protein K2173_002161 [Erythroxylum novogranatense]|uniref:Uncharacterized protein n=1 Tax=Erythroxylum novogranatense TaxID=1862640 RepID=A0AAV8SQG5_9ROSI|nr:hypothetical protein K2173_002161 [Erythroxylum novogranatense]
MDADNSDPSGFTSCLANFGLNSHMTELNKKRKLQNEQLGLPISKHQCWGHRSPVGCLEKLEESQEIEDICLQLEKENADGLAMDGDPSYESVKDSNSFMGDSESVSSVCEESKFESEASKICSSDTPSTSSFNWGSSSFKLSRCSSDNKTTVNPGTDELAYVGGKIVIHHLNHGFQMCQDLEDSSLEFGSNEGNIYPEYDKEMIESCTDKELDNILYSNTANPNIYVLSSGRWNLNQESQPGTRKPTIDQEFEQYFSELML